MIRYFLAGYYVEREDMEYRIDIFNDFGEPIDEWHLLYEINRDTAKLPDGTYKDCFSVNVYIEHDVGDPELPWPLTPKRMCFGRVGKNLLAVYYLKLTTINNMREMFAGCTSFVGFDWREAAGEPFSETDNVTETSHMFYDCKALTSLDLSKLNTAHVESMEGMFEYCESLKDLNLSDYYVDNYDKIFYWDTSQVRSMAFMFRDCKSLETICRNHSLHQLNTKNVETTESMFEGCEMLMSLGLPNGGFDLPNVKHTDRMFKGCRLLRGDGVIDNSLYHVETMESMYEDCVSLEHIGISTEIDNEWNTQRFKNLRNIKNLCKNCKTLQKLPFCNLNLVNMNVDDIEGIIDECYNLETIRFDGLEYGEGFDQLLRLIEYLKDNSPNVIGIVLSDTKGEGLSSGRGLFKGFTNLGGINLNNFNMTNMDDLSEMFMDCPNLFGVHMEGCDASNVRYTDSMFENCTSLNYSGVDGLTLQCIASANKMFKNCRQLEEIRFNDGCMFEFLAVANEMFYGCENMSLLEIPNFDVRRIGTSLSQGRLETDMRDMFNGCLYLSTLKLNNFKINNDVSLRSDITVVTELGDYRFEYFFMMLDTCAPYLSYIEMRDFNNPRLTSMKGMFKNFANVRTIDLSGCNTKNITDMSEMFCGCSSLDELDLSSFDTRNVTTMEGMFRNTGPLTQCDIRGFNYGNVETLKYLFSESGIEQIPPSNYRSSSNVVDVSYMFSLCENLIDVGNIQDLNTNSVENMMGMFWGCKKIESIEFHNFYNFNTLSVKNMSYMFSNCDALVELDLSRFNTENVITFEAMFEGCVSIQKLDLSNFRARRHEKRSYNSMFKGCKNLEIVDISGMTGGTENSNAAERMFEECEKLSHIDMSNFRRNPGELCDSLAVFTNVGINTSDNVLNVGMLYIDDPNICQQYAKKISGEVSKNVKRINIYVQDANVDECIEGFEDIYDRVRFIKYANGVERIDLPMSIPAKHKLYWDSSVREYYTEDFEGWSYTWQGTGVHEKIKIPTYSTIMHLDFNPWVERHELGFVIGEPDVKYVKVQIPMKEKIEEESDK